MWNKKYITLGFILSLLGLSLLICGTSKGESEISTSASVIYIDGSAKVKNIESEKWDVLKLKYQVGVGDEILTEDNSEVELMLKDGSIIKIGSDSHLVIKEMEIYEVTKVTNNRFELIKGKIRAVVVPFINRESKFVIDTENATVGVRGTDFGVIYILETKESYIIGIDGVVYLLSKEFSDLLPIDIGAGEGGSVFSGFEPKGPFLIEKGKLDSFLEDMKILGLGGNDPGTGWKDNYNSLFGPGSGYDGSFGSDSGPSNGHDISGPGSGETERSYKTIIGY